MGIMTPPCPGSPAIRTCTTVPAAAIRHPGMAREEDEKDEKDEKGEDEKEEDEKEVLTMVRRATVAWVRGTGSGISFHEARAEEIVVREAAQGGKFI